MRVKRRKKPKPPVREPEAAICMQSFRPAVVARLIEKGEQLPLEHEAVRSFPSFFRGLVRLDEEEVTDA
jgi:hypothetical protein